MKKILTTFSVVGAVFVATAQSTMMTVEGQNVLNKKEYSVIAMLTGNYYFQKDSRFGVFGFGYVEKVWAEFYVGPTVTYASEKHMAEWGVGIGLETDQQPFRVGTYFSYQYKPDSTDKGKLNIYINPDVGGSGWWYIGCLNYNATTWFGIGAHAQRGVAWGPRVQFTIPKGLQLYLSGGWNIDYGVPGGLIGVRLVVGS